MSLIIYFTTHEMIYYKMDGNIGEGLQGQLNFISAEMVLAIKCVPEIGFRFMPYSASSNVKYGFSSRHSKISNAKLYSKAF